MAAKKDFDYIVVGLGGLGSAAAYWLTRRVGAEVLGLEQFEFGHEKGASEDHSRIIRLTYHTPHYVRLARDAYTAWRELEEESGEQLLVITGDLYMAPGDSAMPLTDYVESMRAESVPFELLDDGEIMRRWPQWRLEDGVTGTFQPQGGIAAARKGVAAHLRLARAHGATLLDRTPVASIKPLADGVEVTTPDGAYRCRRLVLAADAWTNRLLEPLGTAIPLTITEEQVTYFASPHLDEFGPDRFPVWAWLDDPCFYGTSVYGEERGVKGGQDMGGPEVTLETRTYRPDPAALARVQAFMEGRLPRACGPVLYTKTCIYAMPPDRDFVIDSLPAYPQIAVALGSGHAYKFAGLIGRILSDLAVEGKTSYDITPFAIDRPILRMEDPPKNLLLRREVRASGPVSG